MDAVKELKVGDPVIYHNPVGRAANALVTAIWGVTCLNIVLVSLDETKKDSYGRQIEHVSSCLHKEVLNGVHGNYWRLPNEEPNPIAKPVSS